MKVLHVYRTYYPDPPGGLQEAVRQICLGTQRLGVENTVFALSPQPHPARIERPEATVVRCRSWAAPASCDLGGLHALATFRQLVQACDLVHYLFPWPFADLLREAAPRKPSVLTYISDIVRQRWLGRLYDPLLWRTLRSMDAIVTNVPAYAAHSPVLSRPELQQRLHVIPLGIEDTACTSAADPRILERLGLHAGEPFVLFVGVLRYYKGLHTLLQACTQTQGRVVIAGHGPEQAALHAQASALGLHNTVFAGWVTDAEKTALLRACRALVLPSHLRSEAFGMVLLEASLHSKPMISCEIGTGTSYVNLHGETGLVVAPEAPAALAQAMNQLLCDPALALRLGAAARQRYEQHFSGAQLGRAYTRLYRQVLGHS